jgi:hypothetical protein
LSESQVNKRDEKQAIKAYLTARAIRVAVTLKENLPKITVLAMEPWHLADTMLRLGMCYQELIAMEYRLSKDYLDMIHSHVARSVIVRKRWNPLKELIAEALGIAVPKWENNDKRFHTSVST